MKGSCFISGKALFVTFIISLFLSGGVYSQTKNEVFDRITIKDGLSQSTVNYIIQDKQGFMWFATYGGLNKYDGNTFKVYKNIPDDKNSISNDGSKFLFEDSDGYIWVINNANDGFDRFDPISETFTKFKNNPNDSTSISSNEIYHVMQDKSGNIWVCTKDALNLVVNEKKGDNTFTTFKRFYYEAGSTSCTMAYENRNGKLLLFADYLYFFDRKTFKFNKTIELSRSSMKNSVGEDKSGDLWIGTTGKGIVKLKYNSITQGYENTSQNLLNEVQSYRNFVIIDNNERIWMTAQTKGLFLYDIKEHSLLNFLNDKTDLTSISDNTIQSLFIDRSGVLWLGTYSQGLCKLDLHKKGFYRYRFLGGDNNSLPGNAITSIHSLKPDELWIGVDLGGGISRLIFDHGKEKFTNYKYNPISKNSIGSNSTLCLVQRKNGEIWAGGTNGYISKIIPEEPGSKKVEIVKTYKHDRWTFSINEDEQGTLWGGTWEQGLWRFDDIADKFIFYTNDPDIPSSLCDNIIWSISHDNDGNMWIGGHGNGLSILPAKEKNKLAPKFVNFKNEEGNVNSLSNNTIHVIFQDHTGTIWIGTSSGLNRVIINDNNFKDINSDSKIEFYAYHMKNGLPSEGITGILEDNNGNLWLSTGSGICKFDVNNNSFTNYTESDGLLSNEFGHNSYFIDQKGRMYFGGFKGISAFYPDSIKPNPFLPEIVFTGMKLFNKSVQIGEEINGDIILSKSINYTSEIILSHKNNVFNITFAALHYSQPEKNRYAFVMEGFEKEWNYVGDKKEATYTNLDPGTYTFRVKASNNDGIWNEEGISLQITILPPWWKTWWFRSLVVLFSVSMILILVYLRLRSYRNEQKHLSTLVKVRTLELENANTLLSEKNVQLDELNISKDKFFSIIAHDLKNPFSTIIGLSSVLMDDDNRLNNEQEKEIIFNIHSSTEKIFNLLENLLMWSSSQLNRIKITPSFYNLTNQIYRVISLFDDYATIKNIKLIFDENKEIIVFADMQMIETVLRNLITNAIKFSTENNDIKIELVKDNDKEICSIADQGIGMTGEQITNLFKLDKVISTEGTRGEKGTGLGLSLCLDFLEKNGGTIWVKSKPGNGSIFYFSLPTKKKQE